MSSAEEGIKDCQKFYMYCVYRDFLFSFWFLAFCPTLGFSELAEHVVVSCSLVCCTAKCTGGFLGVKFRKLGFKWGGKNNPKTLLKLYM